MRLKLKINSTIITTFLSFGIKIFGATLGFLLNILIARLLGADGTGIYFLSMSIITICSVVSRLGLDNALLKYMAIAHAEGKWDQVKGLYFHMIKLSLLVSIPITLVLFMFADVIALNVFNNDTLIMPLKIMCLSITPITLINLLAESFKGINSIKFGMIIQSAAIPFLNVMVITIIYLSTRLLTINATLIVYLISSFVVLIVSFYFWKRKMPKNIAEIIPNFDRTLLLSTSLPLMWVAYLNIMLSSIDTIMLGWLVSTEDVGIYNIAVKLAFLSSMILLAINGVINQKFSVYWKSGRYKELAKLAKVTTLAMFLISILTMLFLFIFGPIILKFFGTEFISGYTALIILSIGQFFVLATGPVTGLLMMTGYGKYHRNNTVISVLVSIFLNLILIPLYGIEGAAFSTAFALALKNILAVVFVKRELGINVFTGWKLLLKENKWG